MAIKKNYLVEKRNVLNEIRANNMTLQELRFFSIYLAKINSRDLKTRQVRFPLSDFIKIMELDKRTNVEYLKRATDSLLCKVVHVPLDNRGSYDAFQLFKRCTVKADDTGEWYVEIDAHDDALPLMFEFKERYFCYELWNALKLKSSNQLRMYEILKQYERVGERVIEIDELKCLLGIDLKEYERYGNFKYWVLDACQKSLADNTDITFTYEPVKKGRGGKVVAIKFEIQRNVNHADQLSLDDFISRQEVVAGLAGTWEDADESDDDYFAREIFPLMSDACQNEFNQEEIQVLYNLAVKAVPYQVGKNNIIEIYNYMKGKYDVLKWRASQTEIKSRMGYLKKIIEVDAANI
jgi:plasmid replication initiation protein